MSCPLAVISSEILIFEIWTNDWHATTFAKKSHIINYTTQYVISSYVCYLITVILKGTGRVIFWNVCGCKNQNKRMRWCEISLHNKTLFEVKVYILKWLESTIYSANILMMQCCRDSRCCVQNFTTVYNTEELSLKSFAGNRPIRASTER